MRLISLNIWAGIVYEPLAEFFRNYSEKIDVFCLQEVFHTNTDKKTNNLGARANMHNELKKLLPDHNLFFSSAQDNLEAGGIPANYHIEFGLEMATKKNISLKTARDTFVYRERNAVVGSDLRTMARNLQHVSFRKNNKEEYNIFNFHGLWNGQGKSDTEDRLLQSNKVRGVLDESHGKKILCGDFNLLPDTESLKILEKGMVNLVKEFGITSTRSKLYEKPLKFADYILVSPDIRVKSFDVLADVVSDHLPLLVEFD